jgi:Mg-chelatase subunit ChlD
VFLNVLDQTDQHEQVSLASYASNASLDLALVSSSDYSQVRSALGNLGPNGNTAIGQGMQTGIPSLLDLQRARPFAAKTLIVMTDGMHNTGIDPVTVAGQLVNTYDVTIHTVTFGAGADLVRMREVARLGGGNHYHAATGEQLSDVFEEIANNLPTIVTE